MMEIWLRQGFRWLRLPVLPSSIEISQSNKNTTVDLTELGEVNLIGKKSLATISLSSFFPNHDYNFAACRGELEPGDYVEQIQSWMDNPIRLVITGTLNMLMTIESFNYSEQDASGDIYYTMELKEYRIPQLIVKEKYTVHRLAVKIKKPQSPRETKAVKTTTVIVKPGDTLMGIAKKYTGDSNNYIAIANQNKISDARKLRVGQKLVIKV